VLIITLGFVIFSAGNLLKKKKTYKVSAFTETRPTFKIGAILPRLENKFSNVGF